MHILAGFSISILVIYTVRVLGLGMEYLSIIAVLLVGALKEWRDSKGHGTPEVLDLLATIAGGLIGYFITRIY